MNILNANSYNPFCSSSASTNRLLTLIEGLADRSTNKPFDIWGVMIQNMKQLIGNHLSTGNLVCATSVGEIPDYLTDNESVFFAQPGSVESFADAMRQALSDPKNAERVVMNGKQVAQK